MKGWHRERKRGPNVSAPRDRRQVVEACTTEAQDVTTPASVAYAREPR
jgi:hypothetical protein